MATGTTWDDVLSGVDDSEAIAPNAAGKPTKRSKFVGWNDLLAQPSAAPVTLNARRGGFSGDMPPASPESSGLSPLLSRIFPQLLKPSERTGSHYEAAPNQPTPDERLGEMVPQGAVPALSTLNKYAVQPFEKVAHAGAEAGGDILEGTAARVLQPIAAPELASKPTTSMEEMEKRFPTTLGASKGTGKVVGGAVVDPRNWPFFGSGAARPVLQRLISVGFTGLMGKGAVDSAHYLHDNWDKLTPSQRAEIGAQSGLSAALAALTATHALGSEAAVGETVPRSERPSAPQEETGKPSASVPPQQEPYPTAGMPSGRDTSWEDVLRRPAQAARAQSPQFPAPIRESPLISPHEVMGDQGELTGISHATIEGKLTKPLKPIYQMSLEELDTAGKADKSKDLQLLTELFGEQGAKRYNALQRTANSALDTSRADAASAEISRMESALSEEQANKLYGVGEQGPTHEDYSDYQRALGNISGDTPQELGNSMRWAITKMGDVKDPASMNPEQQKAYAELRHGFGIADQQGWDKNAVLQAALTGASGRFQDPEDAAFMLKQFMQPAGTPRPPDSARLPESTQALGPEPAGQPIKGWDEVLQQPQPAPESSTPGPGSPEYEALRKRVAALEPSGARAGSADALRKQADTLTAQIEVKRNPAISQQNPTARRARIAEGMSQDADYLEKVQRHILAVSDAAVEGTLPQSLTGVKSRAQIEDLLRYDKMPRMTFPNTYITGLLKATEHVPGTASARSVVSRARIRGEMPELYGSEELAAAEKLMQVAEKRGTSTKYMRENLAPYKRAISAGLDTSEKWQQARQELKQLAGTEAPQRGPEQRIKAAERELIGQKIPGYFPTPKPLADQLVDTADIRPGMSVLEPSAGKGNIADSVRAQVPGAKLDTVEQQTSLRDILALKGHNVVGNDFLEHQGRHDRIVMNPPFEKGQDIEHVRHAYDLLKPGGRVVAVMSEGPFFRSDSKATAFRDWLDENDGTSEKLPQGSFTGKESERQTGAASRLVILDKPRASGVTQAPRASVSTARSPVALRSQHELPGEYGGESVVKTPTSDLPAKYKLVEAQGLTPSHNAETFAPNPSYPPGVQERAYHTSKEAQARVIQQAQNYDPRYVVNTNPDAVNGPPIVTPDGTVLGGNSRTMSTQRLYERGQGDTYRDYLRKNAQQFGINPDAVDKFDKPVLVREISAPSDVEAARRLGSELNKNMTGALGTSERAVSAGRSITPQSLSTISGMLDDMGSDASIRDLLRERGRDVLTLLTRDGAITERERPQFVDTSTGGLSEEGKQFAERALLGTVVEDSTLMERTPKSILNKLDGSLADISSIAPRTDEYNLLPLIREAIAEHADIAARGLDVETHLAQTGMFGPERNPAVDAIVRKLGEKPKAVREAFRSFARDANADKQGQGFLAMVEQPNATEAFNEAFGAKLTDTEFQQSVLQSLERETQKGKAYEQTTQQENFPPHESLRNHSTEGETGRPTAGTGQGEPRVGRERQVPALPSEADDPLNLFRPGPGAKTASAGNETGVSHLEQLRESLAHVTSPKLSITERIEKALKQSVDFSRQRDSATKAWDRAKSVSVALWDAYRRPAPWTDFKDAIGKYSGALQRSNHELRLFSDEVQRTVPDKLRREALTNYIQADGDLRLLRERAAQSTGTLKRGYETALRLNESERTLANNVRNYFNAQLDEATKAGILENGVEDYVNQLWERNPNNPVARQVRGEIAYSRLQPNPTFAKHRVFESYFEGEQAGFNPKDKDIGFLLTIYQQSFSKAIGARAFIRSLLDAEASDGRPLVAITGRSNPIENTRGNTVHIIRPRIKPSEAFDYQTVNHPALRRWKWVGTDDVSGHTILQEGDLAVHPEAYQHLKNILSTSALRQNAVGRAALSVSSTLKQTLLSMSPFHQVQEGVHATLHGVNPARIAAPRALDLKNPIQSQLIDHGLVVADFDGIAAFQEGVAAGGLISKVPVVGQIEAKYRDYLFRDYIPRLKMEMATEAAKRNFQRYKGQIESGKINRDQIFELTANQANAAFGELNYKMLGRNPTVQDLLRLSVLAPDFLEARMRFTGQAFKPYGREQAVALLLRGAVGMYVSARIINQLLDDDPHWDRPFSVVIKGREYALRSVPGDIYHLISDPRSFVYHRLNPTFTRPAVEALFGRDQLGRPRSAWDQVKDFVSGVAPIPVQGSFDTGKSKLDALLQAIGVSSTKHQSAAGRLARKYVMESGFGFSNKSDAERALIRKYRRAIDDGTFNLRDVANDVKGHKLTIDDAHELELDSKQPALVRDFKSLTLDKALDVWDEMTPEEKKLAYDALETKAVNQLKAGKLLPEARRRMVVRVKQALRPEAPNTGLGQPLVPMLRHLLGSQQAAP